MPERLHNGVVVPQLVYRIYLSPVYRAMKAVAPPAIAALLVAAQVNVALAIPLAIAAVALIVWAPALLSGLWRKDLALVSVDAGLLTLKLEQLHTVRIEDLLRIETKLAYWPGFRNQIVLFRHDGMESIQTRVDYIPMFRFLDKLGAELEAAPARPASHS